MPELNRKPSKFNCMGVDLAHPVDMMPDGYYPFVRNCRSVVAGTVEVRPGYVAVGAQINSGAPLHTIRRVNNLIPGGTPNQLFLGTGTALYAGAYNGPFSSIATGFSGNPLSSVVFRPDQSPESWIYIADQNKMVKANCEQTVRNVGIAPPAVAPTPDIASIGGLNGVTNNGIVDDGNSNTGWGGTGTASAPAVNTRVPASTIVSDILYDTGSNGWCSMSPQNSIGSYEFLQSGCRLIITGSGGAETVTVQEVHGEIPQTTIAAIIYDSGSSGLCSISLGIQTPTLARNSLILLSSTSIVRVLSVTVGPDGLYSFRCNDPHTHVAGDAVRSIVTFRVYTTISIPSSGVGVPTSSTTITGNALETQVTAGVGYATKTVALDLSQFAFVNGANRPLQPDDYMHISLRFDVPSNISSGRILLDVDPVTNDFTQNFYYKEFRQSDLQSAASGTLTSVVAIQTAIQNQSIDTQAPDTGTTSLQLDTGTAQWTELFINYSDLVRVGTNQAVDLANVAAIRVELTVTDTTIMDFSAWWVAGSYGPDVQSGSPVGITYQYRYRDSRTGSRSVPSPGCRYDLYPLRQQIAVGVTASTDPQVDTIDIQRFDPSLAALVYVGSTPNATGSAFLDDTQSSLIAGNPALETNVWQPWPVLAPPQNSVVNVAGTTVQWVSGATFPTNLQPGTVLQVGNDATQLFALPISSTLLEITSNLGALTNVTLTIGSPVLLGQPLPVMFGPLEGTTAIYAFGIGDPLNPGTLYWTNGNDLDSADTVNTLEVTSPSEPLVSGCVWQTLIFVASAKRVFLVTPSFSQNSTGAQTIIFTSTELTSISGSFSPWGMAKGQQGVYMIGRDGLYQLNYNSGSYFAQQIYPLFPHDGKPAVATNGFNPVTMTTPQYLRLAYCDAALMFDYEDSASSMLTFEIDTNGNFWPHQYADSVLTHYWEEVPEGVEPRMLMGTSDGFLMSSGSYATDNGSALFGTIRTPSYDFGDPRTLKLFMDTMTDVNATGGYTFYAGFNNYSTVVTVGIQSAVAGRSQYLNSISSTAAAGLVLYRNFAAEYVIGAGTVLYEFEPSYYNQPFYSNLYTTQLLDHGMPGWKQLRFGRIALISTAATTIQILNDDGVLLANFTVPSSNGILFNDFVQLPNAAKGRMLRYSASNSSPFVLFVENTTVRIKKWGGQQFAEVRPFLQ